jgi:membrane protein implicated in regulation of membrane protease activity
MIANLFTQMGVWAWWILGMILIGIEVFAPGTFFLWFGLAAFVVGAITMVVGLESTVWAWQAQIIAFGVLALVFAVIGRRMMAKKGWDRSDQPELNERGRQLIGREAVLTQPISEGMGRARIGDTTWRVRGPNLPEGTKVRVVSADADTLSVEAV